MICCVVGAEQRNAVSRYDCVKHGAGDGLVGILRHFQPGTCAEIDGGVFYGRCAAGADP